MEKKHKGKEEVEDHSGQGLNTIRKSSTNKLDDMELEESEVIDASSDALWDGMPWWKKKFLGYFIPSEARLLEMKNELADLSRVKDETDDDEIGIVCNFCIMCKKTWFKWVLLYSSFVKTNPTLSFGIYIMILSVIFGAICAFIYVHRKKPYQWFSKVFRYNAEATHSSSLVVYKRKPLAVFTNGGVSQLFDLRKKLFLPGYWSFVETKDKKIRAIRTDTYEQEWTRKLKQKGKKGKKNKTKIGASADFLERDQNDYDDYDHRDFSARYDWGAEDDYQNRLWMLEEDFEKEFTERNLASSQAKAERESYARQKYSKKSEAEVYDEWIAAEKRIAAAGKFASWADFTDEPNVSEDVKNNARNRSNNNNNYDSEALMQSSQVANVPKAEVPKAQSIPETITIHNCETKTIRFFNPIEIRDEVTSEMVDAYYSKYYRESTSSDYTKDGLSAYVINYFMKNPEQTPPNVLAQLVEKEKEFDSKARFFTAIKSRIDQEKSKGKDIPTLVKRELTPEEKKKRNREKREANKLYKKEQKAAKVAKAIKPEATITGSNPISLSVFTKGVVPLLDIAGNLIATGFCIGNVICTAAHAGELLYVSNGKNHTKLVIKSSDRERDISFFEKPSALPFKSLPCKHIEQNVNQTSLVGLFPDPVNLKSFEMKISPGSTTFARPWGEHLHSSAKGVSGAPIFAPDGKVFAMHLGSIDERTTNACLYLTFRDIEASFGRSSLN